MTVAQPPIAVTRYHPDQAERWDAFVRSSGNGTFLHERRYMDYHADRFPDRSLMLWQGDRLCAVLPAHADSAGIASHRGLTYGGLVLPPGARLLHVSACFEAIRAGLADEQVPTLLYKPIPSIYHRAPSDADLYALAGLGAALVQRQVLLVVRPGAMPRWSEQRTRGVRRAVKAGIAIREHAADDLPVWDAFWSLNTANLRERHSASPVHSLDEITLLARRCAGHIRLFTAWLEDALCGGVLIYESAMVARAQYIASDARGREVGAVDAVFAHLLHEVYREKTWFDFGSSHTDSPLGLTYDVNPGLIGQKEGFGASAVMLDTYRVPIAPSQ